MRTCVHHLCLALLALSTLAGCSAEESKPELVGVIHQAAVVQDANFADSVFVAGLNGPTTMTFAPDGR
ncbi:MAG TPA: hypothetical protein VNG33_06830, partial [Polyangiaceae bacterium]|nr:hypothetical protein [Polyangiaceae bacterium]